MAANPHGAFDLILADKASSPTTSVNLRVKRQFDERTKEETLMWRETRVPPIPVRQSQGAFTWSHRDPLHDFIFAQEDWSGGALQSFYRVDVPGDNRYAEADGVDARWQNTLGLGMKKEQLRDFVIKNGSAELNSTSHFTAANGTYTSATAAAFTGTYGHKIVGTGSLAVGGNYLAQTFDVAMAIGTAFTVVAWVRKVSGDSVASLDLAVTYNGTDNVIVTGSTAVQGSHAIMTGRGTVVTTTGTVLLFQVGSAQETSENTWYIDDIMIFPTVFDCVGLARLNGDIYGAFGSVVCKWDETSNYWKSVFWEAAGTASTGIIESQNQLQVAYGYSVAAQKSTNGVSWAAFGTTKTIKHFAKSRQTLWATDTVNTLISSSNAGGSWSSAYTVGSADRSINKLFSYGDTIIVGKEDGLFAYLRVYNDGASADLFTNVSSEYDLFQDSANFAVGIEFKGWLYMGTSQQALVRFNGSAFEDLTALVNSPRFPAQSGKILAIGSDPNQLYLHKDTPTADTSTTKTTQLASLREIGNGQWQSHVLDSLDIGTIDQLVGSGAYLWALGGIYESTVAAQIPAMYRFYLPVKALAPYSDVTPNIETTGTFQTTIWHGGMPDTQKAFISLTAWCDGGLDDQHTIQAAFRLDSETAYTNLPSAFDSDGVSTIFFDGITTPATNAVGTFIQFRFTFTTDDTVSPRLYAFALHSTLRPNKVRSWQFQAEVGGGAPTRTGAFNPVAKKTMMDSLAALEDQEYPIIMQADLDGDGTTETHNVHLTALEYLPIDENLYGDMLVDITLQEVLTS
jgi:hypothetical protein